MPATSSPPADPRSPNDRAGTPTPPYTDVGLRHWAVDAFRYARSRGYLDGTAARPDDPVTVEALAVIALAAAQIRPHELPNVYPDLRSTHPHLAEVLTAFQLGILLDENGRAHPGRPVSGAACIRALLVAHSVLDPDASEALAVCEARLMGIVTDRKHPFPEQEPLHRDKLVELILHLHEQVPPVES